MFEADGWSANPKRDDGWRVNLVEPPAARVRFDDREVVEYARGIGEALAQRYGPPFGCEASTAGTLMQLFAVDGFGVRLYAGYSRVEVEIGQFKPMAEYEYG